MECALWLLSLLQSAGEIALAVMNRTIAAAMLTYMSYNQRTSLHAGRHCNLRVLRKDTFNGLEAWACQHGLSFWIV